MYKLICMSFDGEYKTEKPSFPSIAETWDYCNTLGSKWFFYPFCFVVTESGLTIKDAPILLEWAINRRVKTVQHIFKAASERPDTQGMDAESFCVFAVSKTA